MFNNLKRKFLVIATIIGSLSMFSIPKTYLLVRMNSTFQLQVVGLVLTQQWEQAITVHKLTI